MDIPAADIEPPVSTADIESPAPPPDTDPPVPALEIEPSVPASEIEPPVADAEREPRPPAEPPERQLRRSSRLRSSASSAHSPSSWLEIRLFYVRVSLSSPPDCAPPHLTLSHLRQPGIEIEINGCRVPSPDPTSLPLRRPSPDSADLTYLSTDGVRLSGPASIEVSDEVGNLLLSGTLEQTDAKRGRPSSNCYRDPVTGWTMDCSMASSIASTAFAMPKVAIEVYVAGCFGGAPLILTQTVQLKRKGTRAGNLDPIPEDDDASAKEQKTEEGSRRRKRSSSSSSAMEPYHNNSQSQPYVGQAYPFQFVGHPQHPPQFSSPSSQMQSQYQPQMVQFSYQVPMIPHPHYQPLLNSQYSQVQTQPATQKQSQLAPQEQPLSQEQSQSQNNKKGTPNKRWKPHYDDFLIPFLVEQAREGMKVDKTFKRQAFVAAAIAANDRFHESFTWENVENHMRTLKTKYQEIKKCRELIGAGWDDELKMITLDEAAYQAYVEANPKAKEYLNKPIENYEGLKIICGDDPITGYRKNIFNQYGTHIIAPKPLDTIDLDQEPLHDEEVDALAIDSMCTEQHQPPTPQGPNLAPPHAPASPSSSRNGRAPGRRSRENIEAVIMELVRKVADVADAINNARPSHWTAELYEKIMDLDEFEPSIQEEAFDTLRRDEAEARAFIVKNKMMRRSWMERFMVQRFSQ